MVFHEIQIGGNENNFTTIFPCLGQGKAPVTVTREEVRLV
jgi:hypothetical protein